VAEIEPELRRDLCARLKKHLEGLIEASERRGTLFPDPRTFTSAVYYITQTMEAYKCPMTEGKTKVIIDLVKSLEREK